MGLKSVITLDISNDTGVIIFTDIGFESQITYHSGLFTFAKRPAKILNAEDFSLFSRYYSEFKGNIFSNFPALTLASSLSLPESKFMIEVTRNKNFIYFLQETEPPHKEIYNIKVDKETKSAEFTIRASDITISAQEFLIGFKMFAEYSKQVTNLR